MDKIEEEEEEEEVPPLFGPNFRVMEVTPYRFEPWRFGEHKATLIVNWLPSFTNQRYCFCFDRWQ